MKSVAMSFDHSGLGIPAINATWSKKGKTVAGGWGRGNAANQLNNPFGLFIDGDGTIFVADAKNDRIMKWEQGAVEGTVVAGGKGPGDELNQLRNPIDVSIDSEGTLFVTDHARISRWTKNSSSGITIVRGRYAYNALDVKEENIYAGLLSSDKRVIKCGKSGTDTETELIYYVDNPTGIAVDEKDALYIADSYNHVVFKKPLGGRLELVAGNGDYGYESHQLDRPSGIYVDQLGTLYIADSGNYRIVRYIKGSENGTTIVGDGSIREPNGEIYYFTGVALDSFGNLYVVDAGNNRIQMFAICTNASCYDSTTPESTTIPSSALIPTATSRIVSFLLLLLLNVLTLKNKHKY